MACHPPLRLRHLAPVALLAACGGGGGGGGGIEITSAPAHEAEIRADYSYTVQVGSKNGPVTYELLDGPSGMTLSASGLLEWTPTYADLGQVQVEVKVRDDESSDRQAWTLRVHQGIALGTTLSPRGHTSSSTSQDFIDHYSGHDPYGHIIAFHTNWRESVTDDGEIPSVALAAMAGAQAYGYTPAVGFGWTDGAGDPDLTSESDGVDNSWSNAETASEFLAMVTDFATTYQPPYLFLGNETNSYFMTHSSGEWSAWLTVLGDAYDAVKAASPGTLVFTVFQLERMKGLPPWSEAPHWELVDELETAGKLDAIGFTSYPFLGASTPSALPADYYDEIAEHWTGPVIVTELGWLSAPSPPYPGSEADQEEFVSTFFELTDDLDLEYVTWLFLHDWDGDSGEPLVKGIGFRDNLATVVRLSDAAWRAAVGLRERP